MTDVCILTSAHSPFDGRIYHREAVSLRNKGFGVTIIAPFDHSETTIDGIKIKNLPVLKGRAQRFVKTGRSIFQAAIKQDADIYHFHDPDLIPWMWLLAGRGKRVIYDVHEYTGKTMMTKQWLPPYLRKTFSYLVDYLEKRMSERFAGIVTVDLHMEELFKRRNRNVCTAFNLPPSWFIEKSIVREVTDKKRILYVGSLNKVRGYSVIIDAMRLVQTKHADAVCEIIGTIDYSGISDKYPPFQEPGEKIRNVSWTGSLSFRDVPSYLAKATICWLPLQSTPNYELANPVKLFEYMAAGRPIVASKLETTAKIIEQARCGILVPPNDVKAHAEAICYLLDNPQIGEEMGLNGRQALLEKYNWESQEKNIFDLYERALS